MFLLLDVSNALDSVVHISCFWDERFGNTHEGYFDPTLEQFPECVAAADSCSTAKPLSVQGRLKSMLIFGKRNWKPHNLCWIMLLVVHSIPTAYGGKKPSFSIAAFSVCWGIY